MNDAGDAHVFNVFMLMPHMGLARIEGALESLGIKRELRFWRSVGNEEFPRVEYRETRTPYTLSMGVSRIPLYGFISWVAIQRVHESLDRSSAIRLMCHEAEKIWSRSWAKGTVPDEKIDALVQAWFKNAEFEHSITNDSLIHSTLQSFVGFITK